MLQRCNACDPLKLHVHVPVRLTKCEDSNISYFVLCLTQLWLTPFILDDDSCPDNSACVDVDGGTRFECQCDEGFDVVDLPGLTMNGQAATVCIGMEYSIKKENFGSNLYVFMRISLFWGEEYTCSIIIK